MIDKNITIHDFNIYHKIDLDYKLIICWTYYVKVNKYYKVKTPFAIFNYEHLTVIEKLNLKRDYENIFKNIVLHKLVEEIDIKPIKKEYIHEGTKVNELISFVRLVIKNSAWQKYCSEFNADALNEEDIDAEIIAMEFFEEDYKYHACKMYLPDVEYEVSYDSNNQWLRTDDNPEESLFLRLTTDY
jgi:hypothetical protein